MHATCLSSCFRARACNGMSSRPRTSSAQCSSTTRIVAEQRPMRCRASPEPHSGLPTAVLASFLFLSSSLGPAVQPALATDAPAIQGPARVVDGDTLDINGQKIRLFGLDAPEKAQACVDGKGKDYACGLVSRDALTAKLSGQTVKCSVRNTDQYGRNVASCSSSSGEDVGSWLVSEGYAVAYRQYSKQYIPLEDAAHAAHKGVWEGTFQTPSEWRKQQKAGTAGGPDPITLMKQAVPLTVLLPSSSVCPQPTIKGNISASGERIYHVPGGKQYNQVKIDTAAGERYFCTEVEAQAAGWRRAK